MDINRKKLAMMYDIEVQIIDKNQINYDMLECELDPYGEHVHPYELCPACEKPISTKTLRYFVPPDFKLEEISETGNFIKHHTLPENILKRIGYSGNIEQIISVKLVKREMPFKEQLLLDIQ